MMGRWTPYEPQVALGEHGLQNAKRGTLFLPCRRVAGSAAHQMRDAALPRFARVGVDDVRQVAFPQVGDRLVQRQAHPRHPAGARATHTHALRHALHLPGGHAVGCNLGHGCDDHAVHAREPLDEALGEVATGVQLRDPKGDGADADGESALAVAVAPVAALARLVGPDAHDLVDE